MFKVKYYRFYSGIYKIKVPNAFSGNAIFKYELIKFSSNISLLFQISKEN